MPLPFVYLTLFYIAGILIGSFFPSSNPLFFSFGAGLVLMLCFLFRRSKWLILFFCVFFLFLGSFLAQKALYHYPSHHYSKQISNEGTALTLRGIVRDQPVRKRFETKTGRRVFKVKVPLEVAALKINESWVPSTGKLNLDLFYYSKAVHWKIGEEIQCGVSLKPVTHPKWSRILRRKRILAQGSVWNPETIETLGLSGRFKVKRKLAEVRAFLEGKLAYGLEKTEHRQIMMGLVFGTRADFSPKLKATLMQTNTYHIMAISGFNMTLVIAICTALLSATGLPRRGVALLMMGLILIYMALVGWPPSATRAGLMSLVSLAGWVLYREAVSLNMVAVSAFLILIVSPMQLFLPGFQLSYLVVLSLLFWAGPLHQKLTRFFLIKPKEREPLKRLQKFGSGLLLAVSVSTIAWLSVLPVTLCTFGTFSLYSVAINVLIAGLVTLLTSIGLAGLALNLLWTPLGLYFNQLNTLLMDGLLALLRFTQRLPGCYWQFEPLPNLLLIFFYFMMLIALCDKVKGSYDFIQS